MDIIRWSEERYGTAYIEKLSHGDQEYLISMPRWGSGFLVVDIFVYAKSEDTWVLRNICKTVTSSVVPIIAYNSITFISESGNILMTLSLNNLSGKAD